MKLPDTKFDQWTTKFSSATAAKDLPKEDLRDVQAVG